MGESRERHGGGETGHREPGREKQMCVCQWGEGGQAAMSLWEGSAEGRRRETGRPGHWERGLSPAVPRDPALGADGV